MKRMRAAGDAYVVILVVGDARGAAGVLRDERGEGRRMRGLTFLSAERSAHPLRGHHYSIDRQAEDVGDHFLHFGRILCRRKNVECAELTGPGDGRLRLEIEVILPA